jgi:hypothetical protein
MTPMNLTVRCIARREADVWVAVCVDFALAAQGQSLEQARSRLHEQILVYVREAVTVDAEHAEALLSRKAPLLDRLGYRLDKLISQIKPRLQRLEYIEALPLQPA